jgi:Raf kinase inhibitor-like YbhB/YbcL family protein
MQITSQIAKQKISTTRRFPATTAGVAAALFSLAGCHASPLVSEGTPAIELTTSEFPSGAIPKTFTCDGSDISPSLSWGEPPTATQSFALTVVDIDAPVGSFVHWVVYNIPASARSLPEGAAKTQQLSGGSIQGTTDFDKIGYGGPCPPGKSPHRYVFSLYAVNTKLNLLAGATRKQLEKALRNHVLAHGELIGKYQRQAPN